MTIGELIKTLGGELVQGDPKWPLDGVGSCEFASPSELAFAEDGAGAAVALGGPAGLVVLRPGCVAEYPSGKNIVEAKHPRLWFARAAELLRPMLPATGVHPQAVIGQFVQLGEHVSIGPGAVLDDYVHVGAGTRIEAGAVIGQGVRIGENCRIYPRVVVYSGTSIGNRVVAHAGAVLGADGFGYVRDPESGHYEKFPQIGRLVIEDDVEIGANTTIDRGALDETRIGRGTKIDNLVHIGHNCRIGEDVVIAAQTGISGSVTIEKDAVIGGQVGIGDHARLEQGVIVGSRAGILSNKILRGKGIVFWGTPAQPLKQYLKQLARLAKLEKER